MTDDSQLLCQYVEGGSQAAFSELVQRHLPLVYHSAVRQLGTDAHLAEDVAQSVFVLLSQKSRSLFYHSSLAAWLHTTTHFKVHEYLRKERRRRIRDDDAYRVDELMKNEPTVVSWERLQPVIDSVLLELKEPDREAILMRFFAGQPFSAIAAHLGLSENSAHKRVQRALEKLRERLARHGVKSTAAALSLALSTPTILAAPSAALVSAITTAAISTGIPTATAWNLAALMSTKTATVVSALTMIISGGIALQQFTAERRIATELAGLEQENALLAARLKADSASVARSTQTSSQKSPAAGPSAPTSTSGGLPSRAESQAFLRANPAVRDALYSYFRDTLASDYEPLFAKLGLSASEREQFLYLLAHERGSIVGEHLLMVESDDCPVEEIQTRLRALLGEDRYREYRSFNDAGAVRSVSQEIASSLYFTATPLTRDQLTGLKEIIARATSDPKLGYRYSGDASFMPPGIWDQIMTEAPAVLTESQLEALRELQRRAQFMDAQASAMKETSNIQTESSGSRS